MKQGAGPACPWSQIGACRLRPAALAAIGVDLGLKDTAALSTGEIVAAPKHLQRHDKRLRRYQRRYARQRDAAARRQGLDPARPLPKGTHLAVSNRMRRTKAGATTSTGSRRRSWEPRPWSASRTGR